MGGCCLSRDKGERELRSSNNPTSKEEGTQQQLKHKAKNIVRMPNKSEQSSLLKEGEFKFPTPHPPVPLKSPQITVSF